MKILVIDSCMRGKEVSRTQLLLEKTLAQYQESFPDAEIETLTLSKEKLPPLTGADVDERQRAIDAGETEKYQLAKQFAQADQIIIAAPYWDLAFPAVLKIYLEHICVTGITFHYLENGAPEGLCRAKSLLYLTSCGGFLQDCNLGFAYVQALCTHLFGIDDCRCIAAEGMDITPELMQEGLDKALQEIAELSFAE